MDNDPRNTSEAATAATAAQRSGCGCGCGTDKAQPENLGEPAIGADPVVTDTADSDSACCDLPEDNNDGAGCCTGGDSDEDGDDLVAQLAERTEDLQRVTAEYANFRRRTERDRSAVIATAAASVITDLLPVMDDLDLAQAHGDLSGPLKAVNDKLTAAFAKRGVEKIGSVGDEFNPELHEAVQDLSDSDTKIIGTVLRPGYMMGERLVRTAMVIIAGPEDSDDDN